MPRSALGLDDAIHFVFAQYLAVLAPTSDSAPEPTARTHARGGGLCRAIGARRRLTRGFDLEGTQVPRLWRGFGDRVTLSDCVQGQAAGRTRLRAGGSVAGRLSFDHFDPGRGCPWQGWPL